MKINEIQPGMLGIRINGTISSIGQTREVKTKFGTEMKVATAVLSDESGDAELSLWGDQIKKVKEGDNIEISGAVAKEWNGKLQLSISRQGEIKVLGNE